MRLIMQKHFSSLRPCDQAGLEVLSKIPKDAVVQVEIKRPRSLPQLRMYWQMLDFVVENSDRWPSAKVLDAAIKIELGHCTVYKRPDGELGYIPDSISFERMGQDRFNEFMDRAIDLICQHLIPGMEPSALRAEIERIAGIDKLTKLSAG